MKMWSRAMAGQGHFFGADDTLTHVLRQRRSNKKEIKRLILFTTNYKYLNFLSKQKTQEKPDFIALRFVNSNCSLVVYLKNLCNGRTVVHFKSISDAFIVMCRSLLMEC